MLPLAESLRMAAIGSLVVSPRSSRGFRIKPLEELNPLFNQAAVDPIQSPAQHVGFVLSGTAALPDDIKYRFEFRTTATTAFPWVKFKDLVFTSRKKRELIQDMEAKAGRSFTNEEKDKIEGNLVY